MALCFQHISELSSHWERYKNESIKEKLTNAMDECLTLVALDATVNPEAM